MSEGRKCTKCGREMAPVAMGELLVGYWCLRCDLTESQREAWRGPRAYSMGSTVLSKATNGSTITLSATGRLKTCRPDIFHITEATSDEMGPYEYDRPLASLGESTKPEDVRKRPGRYSPAATAAVLQEDERRRRQANKRRKARKKP